jgi:hypothetical protein
VMQERGDDDDADAVADDEPSVSAA